MRAFARLHLPSLPFPEGGYLVGGAVRDLLLLHKTRDLDFAAPAPASSARQLAGSLGARAICLDHTRAHWRVVTREMTVDYTPLHPGGLACDLYARDFTVNAMAVAPSGAVFGLALSEHDLWNRTIRAVSHKALAADPIRSLRAVRLAAILRFSIYPRTQGWIRKHAEALTSGAARYPAWERVQRELAQILRHSRAAAHFARLERLGLLAAYLPELQKTVGQEQGGYHHLKVWEHTLEALHWLLHNYPHASTALRWATLLHDVGKPQTEQFDPDKGRLRFLGHDKCSAQIAESVLTRLRADGRTIKLAGGLISAHMQLPPQDVRPLRRFLHRRRELIPGLLYLQQADRWASRGPLAVSNSLDPASRALAFLEDHPRLMDPKPLLDGHQVMRLLSCPPGPRVGGVLSALLEAQALDEVHTRTEAETFIRSRAGNT